MKKVLVTGAGGFIGSHLVEALIEKGYSIRAFVHYNSRNSWGWLDTFESEFRRNIDVFVGDICDPFGVKEAMNGCDIVIHLAALISIPYSYHSPSTYLDVNIKGTLNILQAARELSVQRIIQTSTSEVYGSALFLPITEEHPLQGQSPYSASKIGADQLAISFHRSFNLPVIVCRPFNTYGPRQSARAVIPTIILQISSGQRNIKLGALFPTRDFNYVQDTVDGYLALTVADKVEGEVFNLGSGFDISIEDVALIIAQIMGVQIKFDRDDARIRPLKSEVVRLQASNKKVIQMTGWAPHYGGMEGLRRGLIHTIDWFKQKENLNQFKPTIYNI